MKNIPLLLILLIALTLRLYGINWDQNQHLHPDERFLTMVTTAEHLPRTISEYLDVRISPLNPNNVGFNFYVYGTMPTTITKFIAASLGLDNYNDITIVGRALSALVDIGSLLFIYKIVLLWKRKYKLEEFLPELAAFFYAISVLPIQQSHFFTVDSFLVFFCLGSFYWALEFLYQKKPRGIVLSGLFFGMAVASKINAVFILPPVALFLIVSVIKRTHIINVIVEIGKILFIFVGVSYLTLRVADPHFFAYSQLWRFSPNPVFVESIKQLQSFNRPDAWYPPGVQWVNKRPIFFSLVNITFFGLGIPYFLLLCMGLWKFFKKGYKEFILIGLWALMLFFYQSTQYVKSIRYFYLLYPFFAVLSAFGLMAIYHHIRKSQRNKIVVLLVVFVVLWPVSFVTIYGRPHSRVAASQWIYENIPQGKVLAEEHWDDALPLMLPQGQASRYTIEQLPVFDPDGPDKWQKINDILMRADYVIFSSNRGYGSITTAPEKYPIMTKFYTDLFAGKLPFKKIKEFTSYPQFSIFNFQFSIDDQWSDEAFTVYDHPKVTIFKRI